MEKWSISSQLSKILNFLLLIGFQSTRIPKSGIRPTFSKIFIQSFGQSNVRNTWLQFLCSFWLILINHICPMQYCCFIFFPQQAVIIVMEINININVWWGWYDGVAMFAIIAHYKIKIKQIKTKLNELHKDLQTGGGKILMTICTTFTEFYVLLVHIHSASKETI